MIGRHSWCCCLRLKNRIKQNCFEAPKKPRVGAIIGFVSNIEHIATTMTARVVPSSSPDEQIRKQKRLEDLEAKAVAEAKASADSAFRPSPSLLNAASAEALMTQVDGPKLSTYEGKESVYVARLVPLAAGGKSYHLFRNSAALGAAFVSLLQPLHVC